MTIDAQGRIIVVGSTQAGDQNVVVARYLPSGVPDPAFSGDGFAIFGPQATDDEGNAVAVDAQGGILVAGTALGAETDFLLIRVRDDGSLDETFGPQGANGFVTQDMGGDNDDAEDIAVDAQGRILVAGTSEIGDNDFSVARFDSTGKLDTTFGSGGKRFVDFTLTSDDDSAFGMTIDPQGRILLAGSSAEGADPPNFGVARLTADGARDPSFGPDLGFGHVGAVSTPIGNTSDFARAVTVDSAGKILVAGGAKVTTTNQVAVARYNDDGSLDTTFSDDGKVTTPILSVNGGDTAFAVGVDSHSRIVAPGRAGNTQGAFDLAVVRYNPDGSLDPTFGGDGTVTAPGGNGTSAALDAQERIVVAGEVVGGGTKFGLGRFIGDAVAPTPPTIDSGPADGALINDSTPTFGFSATEAGSTLGCGFDGSSATCGSPFTPATPLSDGQHTFNLTASDRALNASAAATRTFTVDTVAPEITIKGKKKLETDAEKAKEKLKIKTSEAAELTCRVDKKKPRPCHAKFKIKLKLGKHKVKVTATDQAGNSSDEAKKIKVVPES